MLGIENSANNFGRSAGLLSNTIANLPLRAALGTLFISSNTLEIFRWSGAGWVTIGGGGGVFSGTTNGCNLYTPGNVGLGGNLTQSTTINCSLFDFTFNNYSTFYIGNFVEPTIELLNLSFNKSIITHYNGNPAGLFLDFANNEYRFGFFAAGSFYMVDPANVLYSISSGNNVGFYINQNINAKFGDWGGSVNNLSIDFVFGQNRIKFYSGDGYYNFANIPSYANNAAALAGGLIAGDIYRHTGGVGETLHIVF
jgi:hypothetical protein